MLLLVKRPMNSAMWSRVVRAGSSLASGRREEERMCVRGQTGQQEGMWRVDNVGWCGMRWDCLDLSLIEGLAGERSS